MCVYKLTQLYAHNDIHIMKYKPHNDRHKHTQTHLQIMTHKPLKTLYWVFFLNDINKSTV